MAPGDGPPKNSTGPPHHPLPPPAPQLLNGGPARDPSQPRTLLPAGRQDHLVVIMPLGLRAHRSEQVFMADDPAGLTADHLQILDGPFHAVLGVDADGVIRPM